VLQFEVADSGTGLCGDRAGRFEHETEIDPSVVRDMGAPGFALAMCSHLTTVLRGKMFVVQVPGAGSRVRVMVPTGSLDGVALLERPSLATSDPVPGGAEHADEVQLAGCRVLFAEDDLVAQKTVSRGLTNAGASVTVAADGPSAVAVVLAADASGRPFDIVVLEGHLTVMGGRRAADFLRARGHHGPVVELVDVGAHDGTAVGSSGSIIVKPFDMPTLVAVIGRHRGVDREPLAMPATRGG
jgi:CheY-like chemotaxis protein